MGINLMLNSVNNIQAGTVIYKLGDKADSMSMILEGSVIVYNQGMKTIMGPGSILGINDVFYKKYMSNYIASQNIKVYTYEFRDKNDIKRIFSTNKDYPGLIVIYLNKLIHEAGNITIALKTRIDQMQHFLLSIYKDYVRLGNNNDLISTRIIEYHNSPDYQFDFQYEYQEVNFYEESSNISEDIQKLYFSNNSEYTFLHIVQQSDLVKRLLENNIKMTLFGEELTRLLYSQDDDCIFNLLYKLIINQNGDIEIIKELMRKVSTEVQKINSFYNEKLGSNLNINIKSLEDIISSLSSNSSNNFDEAAFIKMKDSLKQILDYSEIEKSKKEQYTQYITDFKYLKDKNSISDHARLIRNNVSNAFYDIYTHVYFKAYKDKSVSRVIEMFLNYGVIDESLLTEKQCKDLYYLKDSDDRTGICKVYTIKQWIDAIYEGRKEPSKNEFDLEYAEYVRESRKYNKITEKEEKEYLTSPEKKVEYEIDNLFKYNNRIVSSQISTFVPILHKDMINTDLIKIFNSTNHINAKMKQLISIDYSAFYREVMFYDEAKGIQKEYIAKQAFPDIIVLPTVGANSVMWQEIEGRKRDTSGRYLLPIFGEGDLFDMLVKATGRFRFELCRTIEGISWNNVREKSLTSEYCDYIQSYTKNRDISEEQRDKIKLQVQKGRNNLREIFTLDYITWIQSESQGYIRLNKIVRGIMSTYCPFSKEIREKNGKQPLFEDAMSRFVRDRQKKYRECINRMKKLEKDNIEIPVEIEETLKFYSEM